jgi:serine/threonine protein kinase
MAAGGLLLLVAAALLLALPRPAEPFSFAYNFTSPSDTPPPGIAFHGDAFFNKAIRLTRDERLGLITSSTGRAFYARAVPLADPVSRRPASFATAFGFSIAAPDPAAASGDGLAFFLSLFPSALPDSSAGGLLGLFNSSARAPLVAVEFDTYKNEWDPSDDHVGVDLGGIVSAATADWPTSMKDGRRAHARVEYDADASNLTVALAYGDERPAAADVLLWYSVDLRGYLPDSVAVGFSAATGEAAELHQVLYWEFTSTVDPKEETVVLWVVLGICASLLVLVATCVVWFVRQWRKAGELVDGDIDIDDVIGGEYDELADEFVVQSGPRRFRYGELAAATRNFAEDRKLGQGGFGAVYRGFLKEIGLEVAIKRVSKGSTQGRKEYAAEVRIISQLRHRHLVRLVGWCHEHRGDFLLVYEHMPNGSVDHHLYGKGVLLTWPMRCDVVLGLASAMLYLHEECVQCIVHRDVKPSNVMLDATFSAKLGDFGLAKLVEHGSQPYTTVLAGTLGYLAPECVMTGKASRESDVYSFGVVALEIACGRRPAEPNEEPSKARLVPWVWVLYGKNALLEATDWRLKGEFEEKQMERLMVVGLWCAHPDYAHRPTIRQALNVLKFEAPLPVLPPKMPVPTYFPLPESVAPISVGSSSTTDDPGVTDYGSSGSLKAGKGSSSVTDRILEP